MEGGIPQQVNYIHSVLAILEAVPPPFFTLIWAPPPNLKHVLAYSPGRAEVDI